MHVKSIAECSKGENSAILSTFIKLPFVIKIFVLSIFEWLFYTGFTVFRFYEIFKFIGGASKTLNSLHRSRLIWVHTYLLAYLNVKAAGV